MYSSNDSLYQAQFKIKGQPINQVANQVLLLFEITGSLHAFSFINGYYIYSLLLPPIALFGSEVIF